MAKIIEATAKIIEATADTSGEQHLKIDAVARLTRGKPANVDVFAESALLNMLSHFSPQRLITKTTKYAHLAI